MIRMPAWAAIAAILACAPPEPPESTAAEGAAPDPAPDSLALRTPNGVELWFVAARIGRDSAGRECLERSLEIRDRNGRRRVPLLYTLEAPVVLDDTSVAAQIYHRCAPGDRYRIVLRTGRPVPLAAP